MPQYRNLSLIALRTVKYSDRHSILSAYSLQEGRLSFLVPAGNSREAVRRRALLMPLSIVECTAAIGPRRELHNMRDVSPLVPLHGIHAHPVKASVAMFLADVLGSLLRENSGDEPLFRFIATSIAALNDCRSASLPNFHICFLRHLTRYLGIEPDFSSWTPGSIFDMTDGKFRPSAPLDHASLSAAHSLAVSRLGRITYSNMHHFRFNRSERNLVTDHLLHYYSIHITPLGNLSTLAVLRSL